jgi:hypothetical protein
MKNLEISSKATNQSKVCIPLKQALQITWSNSSFGSTGLSVLNSNAENCFPEERIDKGTNNLSRHNVGLGLSLIDFSRRAKKRARSRKSLNVRVSIISNRIYPKKKFSQREEGFIPETSPPPYSVHPLGADDGKGVLTL